MRRLLAALLFLAVAAPALAADQTVEIIISNPWSRATPKTVPVGVGYMTIENAGNVPDRLIGIECACAERVELHETTTRDGVMHMAPLPDGLEIPAGATVELGPGGTHVMFMGLTAPFKEYERFPATLIFEKSGSLVVRFEIHPLRDKKS